MGKLRILVWGKNRKVDRYRVVKNWTPNGWFAVVGINNVCVAVCPDMWQAELVCELFNALPGVFIAELQKDELSRNKD